MRFASAPPFVFISNMKNSDLFINETDYPDLNADAAVSHLSSAISFDTTGYVDTSKINYSNFDALHDFIKSAYPAVMSCGEFEVIGRSILITLPGSDASLKPALFMAHQDVVPIAPGTLGNWKHSPFSGDIEGGYIWGRGAMDIKQMLIAELESAEYLLSHGNKLKRTVYLAFGEDEETCSVGVRAIRDVLLSRNVQLEYVLDEGAGDVTDAADWGAPGQLICPIGLYEKGYCDLRLSVKSKGGHSSNPFFGTSLGTLADAIHAVAHNMPPARLSDSVIASLKALKPYISEEPLRTWANDPHMYETELTDYFSSKQSLYHLVRTTVAPTMIEGGSAAGNVMPQDMQAIINLRLIPDDTPDSLMERFKSIVPKDTELSWAQVIGASVPSDISAYGFNQLKSTLEHYFDRLIFIPQQNKGATDARWYEPLSRCVMRFGPFLEEEDISAEGIHGTNERISVRAYMQGIRVIISLMENTCL